MEESSPFHTWLKQHRCAQGRTQAALATQLGYSLIMVKKLEAGAARPSRELAEKLAAQFDVPVAVRPAFVAWARGLPAAGANLPATPWTGLRPSCALPVPTTALVGRDSEVARLCALLRERPKRLLTLTGPPGVGKTRLALHLASDQGSGFPDGVVFVPLAAVRDPALVAAAIAAALGAAATAGQTPCDYLRDSLKHRRLLLILDNFEHVLEAAPLVATLLAAAADLRVLVTSRAALRLSCEQEYVVPSLAFPDPAHLPPLAELAKAAAVRLFTERAASASPGFVLTAANAPAVATICARLDGLPLAIELVAAWIKILTPAALLARLATRLPLLTGGANDRPVHQRTLRATIAWSYDLLGPPEQALFRRLAVFAGSCTLAAVEALAGEEGLVVGDQATETCTQAATLGNQHRVLHGLVSLVRQSLLQVVRMDEEAVPDPKSEGMRFVLLETLREYAMERLQASGEAENLRNRHAHWYLEWAETLADSLPGATQVAYMDCFAAEYPHLLAALDWAVEVGDSGIELRLASALGLFWFVRGPCRVGQARLAAALARVAPDASAQRAGAVQMAILLAERQGDWWTVRVLVAEVLVHARERGDQQVIARALATLATAAGCLGDDQLASELRDQALVIYRESGDWRGLLALILDGAFGASQRGDYVQARTSYEVALALQRRAGDQLGLAFTLSNLAEIVWAAGNEVEARDLLARSLLLLRKLAAPWGLGMALMRLADVARTQRDTTLAVAFANESLALFRSLGDQMGTGYALQTLAWVAQTQGAQGQAVAFFTESLHLFREVGSYEEAEHCLVGLGELARAHR